jgi:uncharacterized protein (TIGR00725 family)
VVGILPGVDAAEANPWVTLPVVTGMGEARNAILMRTAQAVIAVGGEYGTLSEIAFALKFGRPVVGLHTWQASGPNQTALPIQSVDSAAEAVAAVLAALSSHEGGQ